MILLRSQFRRWYHFRAPNLSQFNSLEQLSSAVQARIASSIK